MSFAPIHDLLSAVRAGRPVILLDNEDRENEGDFVVAAESVTPEIFNLFSVCGRGLICLVITEQTATRCQVPLMVPYSDMTPGRSTAFTMTVEAAEGVKTGIPFHERIHTIKTLLAPQAQPADIVKPGHIQPLIARPGGVWVRMGHTEASSDLVRLAGYDSAAALIVEVLKEDGCAAHYEDLLTIAEMHHLLLGRVADVFAYRVERELFVVHHETVTMNLAVGQVVVNIYRDLYSGALSWLCHSPLGCVSDEPVSLDVIWQPSWRDLDVHSENALMPALQKVCENPHQVLLLLHVEETAGRDAALQRESRLVFWAALSCQLLRLAHIKRIMYTGPLSAYLSAYTAFSLL